MTKEELVQKLRDLALDSDTETSHSEADELLIQYINDHEIREAYDALKKWYA